jgi:hypothetical protein
MLRPRDTRRAASSAGSIVAAIASAFLLGLAGSPLRTLRADEPAPRRVVGSASVELAGYADTDHVNVASPSIGGRVAHPGDAWSVDGRYLVDAVSAASVDIISTASPAWFEWRHVGSLEAEGRRAGLGLAASGAVSHEPDYLSVAGGLTLSTELRQKTVNPFLGLTVAQDTIGRTGQAHRFDATLDKQALQAGAVLVLTPSTVLGLVLDGSFERGDQAKPYRYVPMFAPGVAAELPAGVGVADVNDLRLPLRVRERLPSLRDRFAVSARLAQRFVRTTLRVDQRLYADSWRMRATTTDVRIFRDLRRDLRVWVHGRLHVQGGVSFWRRAYEVSTGASGEVGIPGLRTGDRELGPLVTATAGAGLWLGLGPAPHTTGLTLQLDGMTTRFADALFVLHRRALLLTLAAERRFD